MLDTRKTALDLFLGNGAALAMPFRRFVSQTKIPPAMHGAGKSTFFRLLVTKDEWFSDDLKKLDDDKVFTKLQGHWIIEMSEMLATSSAKRYHSAVPAKEKRMQGRTDRQISG